MDLFKNLMKAILPKPQKKQLCNYTIEIYQLINRGGSRIYGIWSLYDFEDPILFLFFCFQLYFFLGCMLTFKTFKQCKIYKMAVPTPTWPQVILVSRMVFSLLEPYLWNYKCIIISVVLIFKKYKFLRTIHTVQQLAFLI